MAEWSAHLTHNPTVPGSSPALVTCWICSKLRSLDKPNTLSTINKPFVKPSSMSHVMTLMDCGPLQAIPSSDTGQQMPHFDSCQLTLARMAYITLRHNGIFLFHFCVCIFHIHLVYIGHL